MKYWILISCFLLVILVVVFGYNAGDNNPEVLDNQVEKSVGDINSESYSLEYIESELPNLDEINFVDYESFKEEAESKELVFPDECENSMDVSCIANVASKKDDIHICTFVDKSFVVDCVNYFIKSTGNPLTEYCGLGYGMRSHLDKSLCLFNIALLKNDEDYCVSFSENDEIVGMQDNCLKIIALSKNDLEICKKIEDKNFRNICGANIEKNYQFCYEKKNKLREHVVDGCLDNIAFVEKDISICDKISDDNYANACKASISKDISVCNGNNFCVDIVAVRLEEGGFCDSIIGEKYRCQALTSKDESICDKIENDLLISHCKFSVNLINNNFGATSDGRII